MKSRSIRIIAVLVLLALVTVVAFTTVVLAKEADSTPETAAADVVAQNNGSIRGIVFYDSNQNGHYDAGEVGLPNVVVTILSSGDWTWDYTTGANGTFGPAGLSPDYYGARVTVPYGYVATTATQHDGLGVGIDETIVNGVNFGLVMTYYWRPPPSTGGPPPVVTPPIYPPVVHPPADCTYVVRSGDSLGMIARRYGSTISALATLNDITNPNLIYPGQVLLLPGCTVQPPPTQPPATTTHVVVRGDTLSSIAYHYGTTVSELAALNGISNPNLIYAGQVLIVPAG